MKNPKLITLFTILFFTQVFTTAFSNEMKKETLVWAGIDFTYVRMIGVGFDEPDIFPNFLEKWNSLFVQEQINRLSRNTNKNIIVDVESVYKENRKASSKQIIQFPEKEIKIGETVITDEMIEKQVKKYRFKNASGTALVYIADQFNNNEKMGAIYAVYFDIASRKIISSNRYTKKSVGFGLKNYWFKTIKDVEPLLKTDKKAEEIKK